MKGFPLRPNTDDLSTLQRWLDRISQLFGKDPAAIGSFTRDLTTVTGTQDVTGVGFDPTAMVFFGGINSTPTMSVGFDNASARMVVYDNSFGSAGTYGIDTGFSIVALQAAGAQQVATVQSLIPDGWRLAWTKFGSPTGTATFGYMAFR